MRWNRDDYNDRILAECGGRTPAFLDKFWKYHDKNPHVYKKYRRLAINCELDGRPFSISELTEYMRRRTTIKTQDETGLKLQNNYRAYYARLLLMAHPSFEELMVVKELEKHRRQGGKPRPYDAKKGEKKWRILTHFWATGQGREKLNGDGS